MKANILDYKKLETTNLEELCIIGSFWELFSDLQSVKKLVVLDWSINCSRKQLRKTNALKRVGGANTKQKKQDFVCYVPHEKKVYH